VGARGLSARWAKYVFSLRSQFGSDVAWAKPGVLVLRKVTVDTTRKAGMVVRAAGRDDCQDDQCEYEAIEVELSMER
jgi:hypothetical protein